MIDAVYNTVHNAMHTCCCAPLVCTTRTTNTNNKSDCNKFCKHIQMLLQTFGVKPLYTMCVCIEILHVACQKANHGQPCDRKNDRPTCGIYHFPIMPC